MDICDLVRVAAVDNLSASAPQHCWCPEVAVLCFSFLCSVPTQLSNIYAKAMLLVSQNNKNARIHLCVSSCKCARKMCIFLFFVFCVFVFNRKKISKYMISSQCFPQHSLCLLATILLMFFFTQSFKAEIKLSPEHQLCSFSKMFKANLLAHIL